MARLNRWFLSAGQSNSGTVAKLRDATSPTYDAYMGPRLGGELQNVRLCRLYETIEHPWSRLEAYGPTGITRFGPEIAFARDLHDEIGGDDNIWVIQSSYGSTGLGTETGAWNPNAVSGLQLYSATIAFVEQQVALIEANAATPGPTVFGGIIWTQGEADGGGLATAEAYGDNLIALLEAFDSDLGIVPQIVNRLSNNQTYVTYRTEVQAGQDAAGAARSTTYVRNTNTLVCPDDNLHYDPDSMIQMGQWSAEDIIAHHGWAA